MNRIVALGVCLVILLSPLMSYAVEYRTVDPGDLYYLDEFLENKQVLVIGKDRGRVKVLHVNGAVDWVTANRLLTQSESTLNDTMETIGIFGLGFAALLYMANSSASSGSPAHK